MKRLLIFAVFYFSFVVCDIARSQIRFDSVLIELKNIPSHRTYFVDHRLGQDSYSEDNGSESFFIKIIDSIRTIIKGDSILISGYARWNTWETKQELVIVHDTGVWNSYSIKYYEYYALNDYPLNFGFLLNKVPFQFDGAKSSFSESGSPLIDHLMSYSFKEVDFSGAPMTVEITNKSLSGAFTNSSEVTIQFFGSQSLGIKEPQAQTFSCYPNPASNILAISSPESHSTIHIFDGLGREVYAPELGRSDESVSLNISSLIPGMYWLRTGSQTQKIVIQR